MTISQGNMPNLSGVHGPYLWKVSIRISRAKLSLFTLQFCLIMLQLILRCYVANNALINISTGVFEKHWLCQFAKRFH